jgi:hypothetical protein
MMQLTTETKVKIKLSAINHWEQRRGLSADDMSLPFVSEHWSKHCTDDELHNIVTGMYSDIGLMRLEQKYRNGKPETKTGTTARNSEETTQ